MRLTRAGRVGVKEALPWARCGLLVSLAMTSLPAHLLGQGAVHLLLRAQATLESLRDPGAIVDAAEDVRGSIFMLDARSRVTVLDQHLRLLGTFGNQPGGPMAFRDPISIGVFRDGRVAVLDQARQAITVLRPELGGRQLVPTDTLKLSFFGRAMCVLRDNTFLIYGASHGMRVHVLSRSGRLLRSFAPADPTLDPKVQAQFTMGRVGCDQERDEIVLTSGFLPVVEAYRISTGQRIWADTLRPYRPAEISIRGSGMSIVTWRAGHSVPVTALVLDNCRLLQARYLARRDRATVDTVVSYVFRDTSHTGPAVQRDIPLLVPLGGSKVLSVPAGQSVIQLQDVSVDGCGVGAASRATRR